MKLLVMKEHRFSWVTKALVAIALAAVAIAAIVNIAAGDVDHPWAFGLTLAGFCLFTRAKLSVIRRGHLVTFGSRLMSPAMAGSYRVGYWLMVVGILATFS